MPDIVIFSSLFAKTQANELLVGFQSSRTLTDNWKICFISIKQSELFDISLDLY